jgi:hypothetical protein
VASLFTSSLEKLPAVELAGEAPTSLSRDEESRSIEGSGAGCAIVPVLPGAAMTGSRQRVTVSLVATVASHRCTQRGRSMTPEDAWLRLARECPRRIIPALHHSSGASKPAACPVGAGEVDA